MHHLLPALVGQIVRGAADGERDQMRQMRHDRQHPVVMAGSIRSHHRPAAPPQFSDLLDRRLVGARAAASAASSGPGTTSANPASGPEYSVPAIGCAGTKCTPAGTSGPTSRITDCLVDPTSVSTAPGARCGAIARGQIGECADRRAQHDAVRTLHRRGGIEFDPIGETQFHHPVQRLLRAGVDDDLAPRCRRARGRCARPSCRSARRRAAPAAGTPDQPRAAA